MVVLTIAIVVVFAIPSISSSYDLRQLDSYTSKVAGKMAKVKMHAIKRNRTAWLRIDPINRTTHLQSTDNSGNTINLEAAELVPSRIDFLETSPVEIRFDSVGRLITGNETVTFLVSNSQSTKQKSISVSPAGKVNVSAMSESSGSTGGGDGGGDGGCDDDDDDDGCDDD